MTLACNGLNMQLILQFDFIIFYVSLYYEPVDIMIFKLCNNNLKKIW